jgi:hypothetical protein
MGRLPLVLDQRALGPYWRGYLRQRNDIRPAFVLGTIIGPPVKEGTC